KLSEGQIILIKPKANFKVTVTGTNAGQGKCVFTVVPFKDERPLHKPSLGTFNVSTGGMTTSQKVSPQQADTIVVRAKEGGIVISAAYEEAPEGLVLNTYDIKANSNRVFDVNHHKASRLVLKDKAGDGKASRAKVLVYATIEKKLDGGVTQFVHGRKLVDETINLGEGQSRFWHFEADRNAGDMDVEVLTGGLQARTEQPEKPGLVPPSWARTPAAPTAVQMASTSQASDTSSTSGRPSNTKLSDTKRMVLVLDASGSMWGQIQGKAKIEIAKGVLDKLIDGMPADLQVGLYAYGHRRKGDCADIEMLAPVGPLNKSMLKTKIAAISPKGKTPLSEAVRQAAKTLRYTEERATVVLVSDGLETCDVDPCRLAGDLAMSGVDFTVHVIGFDISEAEQEQLRCLADKTGGLFLAAADAGALQEALSRTVAKVEEPPAPIKENPGTAQVSGPASVPAGSAFDAAWQGPDSRDDYIAIARKTDDDRRYLDYRYTKTGSPVKLIAPPDPGDYELRYVHNHSRKVLGRADIKVTPVQASVQAPAEADVATEFEVNWQGPAYKSDYISIARLDQNPGSYINYTYTQAGSPLKVRAPSDAGTYEVRYILGRGSKLLAKTTIEIKPVGAWVKTVDSADVATEFEVTWNGPANKEDYISIARLDQNPGSYVNYTYTQKGSPLKVRAPSDAGTYEVRYILGRGSKLLAKAGITITPVTAEVDPPTAAKANTVFEVRWKGPGYKQDYISVARPDQKASQYKTYGYTNRGNPCKVKAPKEPGTYEVRYIQGYGKKLLAKKTIRIE
ncbi:MAG: VWA domain-containing protein, partial [Desulfosarcinaceae bacterium]